MDYEANKVALTVLGYHDGALIPAGRMGHLEQPVRWVTFGEYAADNNLFVDFDRVFPEPIATKLYDQFGNVWRAHCERKRRG